MIWHNHFLKVTHMHINLFLQKYVFHGINEEAALFFKLSSEYYKIYICLGLLKGKEYRVPE